MTSVLSAPQRKILKLVAMGDTYAQIARLRGVTEETIKTQMRAIQSRLAADTPAHAVTIALSLREFTLEDLEY